MSDEEFRDPALAINRVYTRHGDAGMTRLVGGQRLSKADGRIESYGTLDELNAFVGMAIVSIDKEEKHQEFQTLRDALVRVQNQLFNLGSLLATLPDDIGPNMPRIREQDITWLEDQIDSCNEDLPSLRSFVLPGGSETSANLHICRTVCRRAERILVRLFQEEEIDPLGIAYVNRLSDAFFVWGRWAVITAGHDEVLWDPNCA